LPEFRLKPEYPGKTGWVQLASRGFIKIKNIFLENPLNRVE
jgi:hypothetical protein